MVEWLTLGVTVVGLGGLFLQIRSAARAQERDHERQKKQATLDAWNDPAAFDWRESMWSQLPNDRNLAAVRSYCPDPSEEDHPHFQPVVTYLNYLENLAVGVHHSIYDLVVLDALAGGRIVAAWQAYEPFVHGRRRSIESQTLWVEFERLAQEIAALGPSDSERSSPESQMKPRLGVGADGV